MGEWHQQLHAEQGSGFGASMDPAQEPLEDLLNSLCLKFRIMV